LGKLRNFLTARRPCNIRVFFASRGACHVAKRKLDPPADVVIFGLRSVQVMKIVEKLLTTNCCVFVSDEASARLCFSLPLILAG
jgi:hypothetical protein